MTPAPGRLGGLATLLLLVMLAACSPGPSSKPEPVATAPRDLTSPVEGVLIDIETEGFSNVDAFTIRTLDGSEITFTMGTLENGVEFPPNHLAEHLAGH